MIWIHRSIKHTITYYTYWSVRTVQVKLNVGGGKLSIFGLLKLQKEEELEKRKTCITNYRKY